MYHVENSATSSVRIWDRSLTRISRRKWSAQKTRIKMFESLFQVQEYSVFRPHWRPKKTRKILVRNQNRSIRNGFRDVRSSVALQIRIPNASINTMVFRKYFVSTNIMCFTRNYVVTRGSYTWFIIHITRNIWINTCWSSL